MGGGQADLDTHSTAWSIFYDDVGSVERERGANFCFAAVDWTIFFFIDKTGGTFFFFCIIFPVEVFGDSRSSLQQKGGNSFLTYFIKYHAPGTPTKE